MTSSQRTINSPGLFDPPAVPIEPTAEERFRRFHEENPNIYDELVRRARALKEKGYTHIGIRLLWESLRYDAMVQAKDASCSFRLNDHYPPRYSRMIMSREKDLAGLFEVRGESA